MVEHFDQEMQMQAKKMSNKTADAKAHHNSFDLCELNLGEGRKTDPAGI